MENTMGFVAVHTARLRKAIAALISLSLFYITILKSSVFSRFDSIWQNRLVRNIDPSSCVRISKAGPKGFLLLKEC